MGMHCYHGMPNGNTSGPGNTLGRLRCDAAALNHIRARIAESSASADYGWGPYGHLSHIIHVHTMTA